MSYRYLWLESAWGKSQCVRVTEAEEAQMKQLVQGGCRLRSLEVWELAKSRIADLPSRPDYTCYLDR